MIDILGLLGRIYFLFGQRIVTVFLAKSHLPPNEVMGLFICINGIPSSYVLSVCLSIPCTSYKVSYFHALPL